MSQQLELLFEKDFAIWKIDVYISIATTTLIIYDYLSMLPAEIQQVWLRPKSLRTILFIFLRYSILLGQVIPMTVQFIRWDGSSKTGELTCNVTWRFSAVLGTTFLLAVTVFASLRIRAISTGHNLFKAGVIFTIGTISAVFDALSGNSWTIEPLLPPFSGCAFKLSSPVGATLESTLLASPIVFLYISSAFALFAELLVQVYTWQRTYKILRDLHVNNTYRPLFTLFLRDGTLVYLTTIALHILVCATATSLNLIQMSLAVDSILICRIMLRYREILYPLKSAAYQEFSTNKTAQTQRLDTVVFLIGLTDAEDGSHCEEQTSGTHVPKAHA